MDIFITGAGVICSAGNSLAETAAFLRNGKPALKPVRRFATTVNVPVGEVGLSDNELKDRLKIPESNIISRTALLAIKAIDEALADRSARFGVREVHRTAFVSGTSVGGMDLSEVFWNANRKDLDSGDIRLLEMHDPGGVTRAVQSHFLTGGIVHGFDWNTVRFSTTVSTACSAAANAIMLGARMIKAGLVDCAIVGGTDALCKFTLNGFNSLRILSPHICRPFDHERDGLNLGEGAGYIIIESLPEEKAANAYCRLGGWGNANEAYHQTASTPEGTGPGIAMQKALDVAGIDVSDIGFINTHGTGTQINDSAELNAMLRIFGGHIPPFSSVKPFIGHTLGASEGIEAALSCLALNTGDFSIMRSYGWHSPVSDGMPAPYRGGCEVRADAVMSSAFGFSGNCVSLIFTSNEKRA